MVLVFGNLEVEGSSEGALEIVGESSERDAGGDGAPPGLGTLVEKY